MGNCNQRMIMSTEVPIETRRQILLAQIDESKAATFRLTQLLIQHLMQMLAQQNATTASLEKQLAELQ